MVLQVKSELEDRFGKVSESVEIYMYEEWFEKLAKKLEIEKVNQTKNYIELIFSENMTNKIDGEKRMYIGEKFAGETFIDALGNFEEEVTIDEDGCGVFKVKNRTVSVWVEK